MDIFGGTFPRRGHNKENKNNIFKFFKNIFNFFSFNFEILLFFFYKKTQNNHKYF